MGLPTTNLTMTQIKNALSETVYNVSGLNTSSNINRWSFFKPGRLSRNTTTKEITYVADTAPYKMGDFRKYEHSAGVPGVPATATYDFFEDVAPAEIAISINLHEMNYQEVNGSISHILLEFYNDSSRSTFIQDSLHAISTQTYVVPPGHSTTETTGPGAPTVCDVDFETPDTYDPTVYMDVWLSDGAKNKIAKLPNWQQTVTLNKRLKPKVNVQVVSSTIPSGYANVLFVKTAENNTTGSFNFTGYIEASETGTPITFNRIGGQADFKYDHNGTEYNISLNDQFTTNVTINTTITGVDAPGDTLQYDETIQVKMYIDYLDENM